MIRGRKPKPTHLKLVTGNPGKRPLPKAEAKVAAGLPDPPPELMPEGRGEWDRIVAELHSGGLITKIDRGALAACCQAYGRWMQAEKVLAQLRERDPVLQGLLVRTSNGNHIQNPLIGIANKAMADYVRYCAEFGMTPSSRSRIGALPPPKEEDPAESYFR